MTKTFKKKLEAGPVTFEFKKKDGSVRKMTATTNPEYVGSAIVQRSSSAYTVWDIERGDFRSISEDAKITVLD